MDQTEVRPQYRGKVRSRSGRGPRASTKLRFAPYIGAKFDLVLGSVRGVGRPVTGRVASCPLRAGGRAGVNGERSSEVGRWPGGPRGRRRPPGRHRAPIHLLRRRRSRGPVGAAGSAAGLDRGLSPGEPEFAPARTARPRRLGFVAAGASRSRPRASRPGGAGRLVTPAARRGRTGSLLAVCARRGDPAHRLRRRHAEFGEGRKVAPREPVRHPLHGREGGQVGPRAEGHAADAEPPELVPSRRSVERHAAAPIRSEPEAETWGRVDLARPRSTCE